MISSSLEGYFIKHHLDACISATVDDGLFRVCDVVVIGRAEISNDITESSIQGILL